MFQLSKEGLEFVKSEMARYETKESAIISCLFCAQKENGGWVSPEVIAHLSQVMGISESKIEAVNSFYTMFNKKPVGRYHIQVCTNISCATNSSRELKSHILQELGVKVGEVTHDGRFCVSEVECLGSCGTAPVMQINETYYEGLNPQKAVEIIRGLK